MNQIQKILYKQINVKKKAVILNDENNLNFKI